MIDLIMITQNYWKAENMTQSSVRIARFLPPELSSLLQVFLCIVKPQETIFAGKLYGPEAASLTSTYFLVSKGKRPADDTVRGWFRNVVETHGQLNLNASGYRLVLFSFRFV